MLFFDGSKSSEYNKKKMKQRVMRVVMLINMVRYFYKIINRAMIVAILILLLASTSAADFNYQLKNNEKSNEDGDASASISTGIEFL